MRYLNRILLLLNLFKLYAARYVSYLLILFCSQTMAIEIYGHRGARALSPENTLPGYQTAIEIGVDYIDMDVMLTKDGEVVVTHDYYLNPDLTRDQQGHWLPDDSKLWIKEMTYDQLEQYDVGQIKPNSQYERLFPHQKAVNGTHIPRLRDVIRWAKKQDKPDKHAVKFQIELKNDPNNPEHTSDPEKLAHAVAKILSEEEVIDRTEVQAFDWQNLFILKKINDQIKTAFLTDTEIDLSNRDPEIAGRWTAGYLLKDYVSIPDMIASLGGDIWGPKDVQLRDKNQVKKAQQLGLKVVPWYVAQENDDIHARLERLLALGVDGIITDKPHVLKAIIEVNKRNVSTPVEPEPDPENKMIRRRF